MASALEESIMGEDGSNIIADLEEGNKTKSATTTISKITEDYADTVQAAIEGGESLKDVIGDVSRDINIQGLLDAQVFSRLPEEYQILSSFFVHKTVFEIAFGLATSWDSTPIAIQKIRNDLKKLQEKVNLVLEMDYRVACDRFNEGLLGIKHDFHEAAHEDFQEARRRAESAYRLSRKFKDKLRAKWLNCYLLILTNSYEYDSDSMTKKIKPLTKLSERKQRYIADKIFNQIKSLVVEFEQIKLTWTWVPGRKKDKQREQDMMDQMLRLMLPYMWSRVQLFENVNRNISSTEFNFERLMENTEFIHYIPEGWMDRACVEKRNNGQHLYVFKETPNNIQDLELALFNDETPWPTCTGIEFWRADPGIPIVVLVNSNMTNEAWGEAGLRGEKKVNGQS